MEGEAIISTVEDTVLGRSTTITESYKDFVIRIQDTDVALDNAVEFDGLKLSLPDGYTIESSIGSDADVDTYISVGDTSNQGKGVVLFSRNTINDVFANVYVYNDIIEASVVDGNTNEGYLTTTQSTSYTIQSPDNNITYFGIYGNELLYLNTPGNIRMKDLPIYADDAAADADVDLVSGCLYKVTGSRAVYQKP